MFGPLSTTEVGGIGLWGAAVLTLITGAEYLIAGIRHIAVADAREDKIAAAAKAEADSGDTHRAG